MTIYNFGSINADYFYQVPHNPAPGETLAATGLDHGLGGKGANQSVAMVQAGADVVHLGAVGRDGEWLLERLVSLGVATDAIARLSCTSGHAIITVAADGENAITLYSGANTAMSETQLTQWLAPIREDDWLVMQNETAHQVYAARMARAQGARVVYSAAPFEAKAAAEVLPFVNILCANEHELEALQQAQRLSSLASRGLDGMLITYGSKGAAYHDFSADQVFEVAGIPVTPVDTTGAGDTFCGYFIARLSLGEDPQAALTCANRAAALTVTRSGTAEAIPSLQEVMELAS